MRCARSVFDIAGLWGIAVLTPRLFLVDIAAGPYVHPADDPPYYYGFLTGALAWEIAFLMIGFDPISFRSFMIAAFIVKAGYIIVTTLLYSQGRIGPGDAGTAFPDSVLLALFVVAFTKTRPAQERPL